MTEAEIRKLIDQAAEKGAACALRRVGLSDQDAGRDVRELRELLVAWRDVRVTVRRTIVGTLIKGLLLLIVLAVGIYVSRMP